MDMIHQDTKSLPDQSHSLQDSYQQTILFYDTYHPDASLRNQEYPQLEIPYDSLQDKN